MVLENPRLRTGFFVVLGILLLVGSIAALTAGIDIESVLRSHRSTDDSQPERGGSAVAMSGGDSDRSPRPWPSTPERASGEVEGRGLDGQRSNGRTPPPEQDPVFSDRSENPRRARPGDAVESVGQGASVRAPETAPDAGKSTGSGRDEPVPEELTAERDSASVDATPTKRAVASKADRSVTSAPATSVAGIRDRSQEEESEEAGSWPWIRSGAYFLIGIFLAVIVGLLLPPPRSGKGVQRLVLHPQSIVMVLFGIALAVVLCWPFLFPSEEEDPVSERGVEPTHFDTASVADSPEASEIQTGALGTEEETLVAAAVEPTVQVELSPSSEPDASLPSARRGLRPPKARPACPSDLDGYQLLLCHIRLRQAKKAATADLPNGAPSLEETHGQEQGEDDRVELAEAVEQNEGVVDDESEDRTDVEEQGAATDVEEQGPATDVEEQGPATDVADRQPATDVEDRRPPTDAGDRGSALDAGRPRTATDEDAAVVPVEEHGAPPEDEVRPEPRETAEPHARPGVSNRETPGSTVERASPTKAPELDRVGAPGRGIHGTNEGTESSSAGGTPVDRLVAEPPVSPLAAFLAGGFFGTAGFGLRRWQLGRAKGTQTGDGSSSTGEERGS